MAYFETESERLARALGKTLAAKGWMLATVESCTGGMIAAALTAIPGSSAWFERGLVTYSNQSKMDLAQVKSEVLAAHGAVSEATAREMAVGGRSAAAGVALSVTGIAGPDGGTATKPVGMVCFAWALPGREDDVSVYSDTRHFEGGRREVREQAVVYALSELLARIGALA